MQKIFGIENLQRELAAYEQRIRPYLKKTVDDTPYTAADLMNRPVPDGHSMRAYLEISPGGRRQGDLVMGVLTNPSKRIAAVRFSQYNLLHGCRLSEADDVHSDTILEIIKKGNPS